MGLLFFMDRGRLIKLDFAEIGILKKYNYFFLQEKHFGGKFFVSFGDIHFLMLEPFKSNY